MERKKNLVGLCVAIISLLHLVGIVGFSIPSWRPLFQILTPLNLILSAVIVLYFQSPLDRKFLGIASLIFALGYGVEVAGVQTGVIFGEYAYGPTLGWKIADVPLMMGVLWLLLIYGAVAVTSRLNLNWPLRATFGAFLLVSLDIFLEPVAIKLEFWDWAASEVPIQNYVSWFIIAWILISIFIRFAPPIKSLIGQAYLGIQFIFFFFLQYILSFG